MNQRILSCPSTLLTKGITMKAGDWKTSDATPELLDMNRMKRFPDSAASLPTSWKLKRNNSSTLFRKQMDIQRNSSSNLSQTVTDSLRNSSSTSNMGNASWDDKPIGGMASKQQTNSGRLSVNLLDLVQVTMNDPFKQHGHRANRSPDPSPSETVVTEAPGRPMRRLSTILDLCALDDEEESFGTASAKHASCDEKEDDNAILDALLTMSRAREEVYLVKTFKEKDPKLVDMRSISSSELGSLKEDDPFMYYSIPAVRSAAMHGNDVDLQAVKEATKLSDVPSSYERKTRISVESCLIPGLTDMSELDSCGFPSLSNTLYNMDNMDDSDDEDSGDDWLYAFSGL
ncbi:hypothetical protein HJC23_008873 [Cyclotella cryptica]|uniref:Uncharacterized protein n=1 Tax=Cyclotella cryptica TaxID=29204 RepID=A0ABD3PC35_9STRA|eukprot:CCRYP_015961-RA/>CCRYP_015961-RA protein AED:0.17 eAED:0.17 QI:0/-1/0/1/-1/1/1/0/343